MGAQFEPRAVARLPFDRQVVDRPFWQQRGDRRHEPGQAGQGVLGMSPDDVRGRQTGHLFCGRVPDLDDTV